MGNEKPKRKKLLYYFWHGIVEAIKVTSGERSMNPLLHKVDSGIKPNLSKYAYI